MKKAHVCKMMLLQRLAPHEDRYFKKIREVSRLRAEGYLFWLAKERYRHVYEQVFTPEYFVASTLKRLVEQQNSLFPTSKSPTAVGDRRRSILLLV